MYRYQPTTNCPNDHISYPLNESSTLPAGLGIVLLFFLHLIVKQHPDGGRVGIVVLATFVGPKEGCQENQGDEHAAADKEKDGTHDGVWIKRCFEA